MTSYNTSDVSNGNGIIRDKEFVYDVDTPTEGADIDTLYDPRNADSTAKLSVILGVNVTTPDIDHALFETVDTETLIAFPMVRITSAAEFEDSTGDVSLSFWYSDVTHTIHYQYDIDATGKTVYRAVLLVSSLRLG